ncbi:MAG TPA: hypothetical protein VML55_19985 [Planctomycetaceae bacterium]|nr:hypothetical protein [Planctomycetaceae bacterium]
MEPDAPVHWLPLFVVAAAVTAVWLLALAGLALFTANPVTLNRYQIETSPIVIAGHVLDGRSGEVAVERVWRGQVPDRVRVANLADTPAARGRTYLMPLLPTAENRFVVTATGRPSVRKDGDEVPRPPDGPPLIYRATPEAIEQLQQILEIANEPRPSATGPPTRTASP